MRGAVPRGCRAQSIVKARAAAACRSATPSTCHTPCPLCSLPYAGRDPAERASQGGGHLEARVRIRGAGGADGWPAGKRCACIQLAGDLLTSQARPIELASPKLPPTAPPGISSCRALHPLFISLRPPPAPADGHPVRHRHGVGDAGVLRPPAQPLHRHRRPAGAVSVLAGAACSCRTVLARPTPTITAVAFPAVAGCASLGRTCFKELRPLVTPSNAGCAPL